MWIYVMCLFLAGSANASSKEYLISGVDKFLLYDTHFSTDEKRAKTKENNPIAYLAFMAAERFSIRTVNIFGMRHAQVAANPAKMFDQVVSDQTKSVALKRYNEITGKSNDMSFSKDARSVQFRVYWRTMNSYSKYHGPDYDDHKTLVFAVSPDLGLYCARLTVNEDAPSKPDCRPIAHLFEGQDSKEGMVLIERILKDYGLNKSSSIKDKFKNLFN